MSRQDIFNEIAKIVLRMPRPGDVPDDVISEVREQVGEDRENLADNMRWNAEEQDRYGYEPVLAAIREARRRRDSAEAEVRRLLAYAREFTLPRTYRLTDLADACGMSISGVRTAYDEEEIDEVAEAIGASPRDRTTQDASAAGQEGGR